MFLFINYTRIIKLGVNCCMKTIISLLFINLVGLNAQTVDQIKKQLNNTGLSNEQIKQISKEKGSSNERKESKLGDKLNELDSDIIDQENLDISVSDPDEITDENSNEFETIEYDNELAIEYFGYQIFQGDPTLFQSSVYGVVDPNYNIGPGDQVILMIWGEYQFRQEFTVDREGYVFLPEVGQVFVNGLNLEALEKKFFQILSKVYSTLNPITAKPTTFMDVSLGNLRPLRIIVLGELNQPGAYSVSPSTSLSSSLYYFKGPTTSGSLRDIKLLRKGKFFGSIDFYDYLLSGDVPDDIRLQMDDIVFIPARGKTVTLEGEINRQGIYELKEKEYLIDLIKIAGNLSPTAYMKRAQISRIVPKDKRLSMGMDRMVIDIDLQKMFLGNENIELFDGDEIQIFRVQDLYENYVTINSSSVVRPGRYELIPGMRLLDIIDLADGLLSNAYLEKVHIKRILKDLTKELITINMKDALAGELDANIKLEYMDEIFIYNSNQLMNSFSTVSLSGPLKKPGDYELENGKTLGDLLVLAGGLKTGINKIRITVSRLNVNSFTPIIFNFPKKNKEYIDINDINNPNSDINKFLLSPFDIISVYSDPRDLLNSSVTILGAVYHPGAYPILSKDDKLTDIISRSGGLLEGAYPRASIFIRESNSVKLSFKNLIKNPSSIDNFRVFPGDTIIINTKKNIVEIVGEVNQPGVYKFYDGYNMRKYLKMAGGLTSKAELKEIWVTYPDGISKKYNRYLPSPSVYSGSIINIGTKDDIEPINKTEFAKEISSIVADFLQIYITLTLLARSASDL